MAVALFRTHFVSISTKKSLNLEVKDSQEGLNQSSTQIMHFFLLIFETRIEIIVKGLRGVGVIVTA